MYCKLQTTKVRGWSGSGREPQRRVFANSKKSNGARAPGGVAFIFQTLATASAGAHREQAYDSLPSRVSRRSPREGLGIFDSIFRPFRRVEPHGPRKYPRSGTGPPRWGSSVQPASSVHAGGGDPPGKEGAACAAQSACAQCAYAPPPTSADASVRIASSGSMSFVRVPRASSESLERRRRVS
ncbi:hypothetical protein VTO73DRAFT_9289 [Trametes versicolor]